MKDVVWIRAVGEHSREISTVKDMYAHAGAYNYIVETAKQCVRETLKVRLSIRYKDT